MTQFATIHGGLDELLELLQEQDSERCPDWVDLSDVAAIVAGLLEIEMGLPAHIEVSFAWSGEGLWVTASNPTTTATVEAALADAWEELEERAIEGGLFSETPPSSQKPPSPPKASLDAYEERLTAPNPGFTLDGLKAAGLVAALGEANSRARAIQVSERVARIAFRLSGELLELVEALRGTDVEAKLVRDVARGEAAANGGGAQILFAVVDRLAELDSAAVIPALLERLERCPESYHVPSCLRALSRASQGSGDRDLLDTMLGLREPFPRLLESGDLWKATHSVGGLLDREQDELLAAWPEGNLERMYAGWQRRGWQPQDVAEQLRRRGVPVCQKLPSAWPTGAEACLRSAWPTGAEACLRSVLGDRLGVSSPDDGRAKFLAFLEAIRAMAPDDAGLSEVLLQSKRWLLKEELDCELTRLGLPDRVLHLEQLQYSPGPYAVLAPEAGFRAAAAELGIPIAPPFN